MNIEKKLTTRYFFHLTFIVLLDILLIALMTIPVRWIIVGSIASKDIWEVLATLIPPIVLVFNIPATVRYIRDFSSVWNKKFEVVTGKVIAFKRHMASDEADVSFSPVFLDEQTGAEIKPNLLNDREYIIKRNEYYTFIYLKKTKLAVIKEKHG